MSSIKPPVPPLPPHSQEKFLSVTDVVTDCCIRAVALKRRARSENVAACIRIPASFSQGEEPL